MTQIRKRCHKNMTRLHELNYVKLLCIVPDINAFALLRKRRMDTKESSIIVNVDEHTRFTTQLSFDLQHPGESLYLGGMFLQIRMYHDAKVAEVVSFQRQHRFDSRYHYPNPKMHQRNEKQQLNFFLGEWLDYCIGRGIVVRFYNERMDA